MVSFGSASAYLMAEACNDRRESFLFYILHNIHYAHLWANDAE